MVGVTKARCFPRMFTCFWVRPFPSAKRVTHDILSDCQPCFLHEPFYVLSSLHVMMCEY